MERDYVVIEPGFFVEGHFGLLAEWQGAVYDGDNPEHVAAYQRFKQVYELVAKWAEALKERMFGAEGSVKVRRKPTAMFTNKFQSYLWAKLYPPSGVDTPLAYTVSITAHNLYVGIDLVEREVQDPQLLERFNELKGEDGSALSAKLDLWTAGTLGLDELLAWSEQAIHGLPMSYAQVQQELGLVRPEARAEGAAEESAVIRHFLHNEAFSKRFESWGKDTQQLFVRLALAVHSMKLDWYFVSSYNSPLRFGRRENIPNKNAKNLGWLALTHDGVALQWEGFAGVAPSRRVALSAAVLDQFVSARLGPGNWPVRLGPYSDRPGFWPDDYLVEMAVGETEEEPWTGREAENSIYYGPPGTGKTLALQERLIEEYTGPDGTSYFEFVTFHQSYGYEQFIEGLFPVLAEDTPASKADVSGKKAGASGDVSYEIRPGVFIRLCERARDNPERRFAMVIDEINRGNISKIFGELITLIEADKREDGKYPVHLRLPYSGKQFCVPSNVDILASMNTADRSLAPLDTALRRRFQFREYMPKPNTLRTIDLREQDTPIDVERLLATLNERIAALYDRDHTIGHAYFIHIGRLPAAQRFHALTQVFENKIFPLLEEYFFEDWGKIRLVLGDNQKSDKALQFVHVDRSDDQLAKLFGGDGEIDEYTVSERFQINTPAFRLPQAYAGIYAPR
jgi:5-methylcytosine-specific restriction protein B